MKKILDHDPKSQYFSCGNRKAKRNYANKEDKEIEKCDLGECGKRNGL